MRNLRMTLPIEEGDCEFHSPSLVVYGKFTY